MWILLGLSWKPSMTYLFTIIDRFTRWSVIVPLPDAHASTCASALLHHWIARFGVSEEISSDRGRQITSTLWTQLNNRGQHHSQANGMVELLHRKLKATLKVRNTSPVGLDELPMVLLGFRSSWFYDAAMDLNEQKNVTPPPPPYYHISHTHTHTLSLSLCVQTNPPQKKKKQQKKQKTKQQQQQQKKHKEKKRKQKQKTKQNNNNQNH